MSFPRIASVQPLRTVAPLLLALLLASCAPPSARREAQIGTRDAAVDVSPETEPADNGVQDGGVPSSPDALVSDGPAISDQVPGQPDLPAGPPDAAVPDAAAPDTVPPPDTAPPDTAPPDTAPPDTSPPDRGPIRALLVVIAPPVLATDDELIRTVLQSRNMTVTLGDDDGDATQAAGMDLVVISGSVSSVAVGTKYTNLALPVLTMESFGFGNMGMTGMMRDIEYGSTDALTDIAIVLPAHPLAAGLPPGTLTVTRAVTRFGWGVVSPMADTVATIVGTPSHAVIFSYEPGDTMFGLLAPARRVGLFPLSPTPDQLNAAGSSLLEAAVDWIARP